ncbi:TBC domain-containing protein [Phlyctema vagabunda]|uniref:TBC domain-containing protein n=1 Tax=Phlyctema vagabunda TaxID=108571 RepID=A0ABR4P483_9HELO
MTFSHHAEAHLPGSPPELTESKSSKSSSFHSYQSDEGSILENGNHFEEIGLDDDDARSEREVGEFAVKTSSNPYTSTYTADLRSSAKQRSRTQMATAPPANSTRSQRELTSSKARPTYPSLRGQVRSVTTPTDGLGLLPSHTNSIMSRRGFTSPSVSSLPLSNRRRSPSPAYYDATKHLSATSPRARRGSWQSNRERKTALELEQECDEDDGDDLPDEVLLENVPMSPRPPHERAVSTPASTATSPDRQPKEKVRSVGNGTSPLPVETGCLRSPKPGLQRGATLGQFPMHHPPPKGRAKSWTSAMSALSEEAKALTAALEEHAVEEEAKMMDPTQRRSLNVAVRPNPAKPRIKSAFAELPPLRRTEIMIDPLPISKEKEAVLSRTRPSWLPPKNPAEERRHLKEYQKMMAQAQEADRKREAQRSTQSACRDDTASSLLRIWEEHVLPNWDNVTRQKRTRELWWRGIAPRSRGSVWSRAVGNELELSDASFQAALKRAQDMDVRIQKTEKLSHDEARKKRWFARIDRDVAETYTELRIFQPGGPLHSALVDVLRAYSMYRSDVGYVPGTSTIAAILLLNLATPSASFITLANILNRSLPLSFHTCDTGATSKVYSLLLATLQHKSPRLHAHLTRFSRDPDVYLRQLFMSLFTASLSLDNATRLWDVMVFEGDSTCVRAAVAFLVQLEGHLFGCSTDDEIRSVISKGLDGALGEEEWMLAVREAGKSQVLDTTTTN